MSWSALFIIMKWFIPSALFGAFFRYAIFKFIRKKTDLDIKWGIVVAGCLGVIYSFLTYNSFDSSMQVTEDYIVNQAILFCLFVAAIIDRIESWVVKFRSSEEK